MNRQIRLAAVLLVLVLLTGCVQPGATSSGVLQPEPSVKTGNVCYIPLDDRPDNLERVEYLANSLGYTLLIPEEDLFRTKLDSQPLNENGTQYGHRAALYEWVLAQDAAGCDRYILFMDQLTSGGLVNSRHMSGSEPLTLSDGTSLTESDMLDALLTALAADGSNTVWLLDTVMRLAPTVGYDGFGIAEYNALRAYGSAARPVLTGSALTADAIVADYPLGADGKTLDAASFEVTTQMAQNYFAARERKLRLSAQIRQTLAAPGYENFRLLIGIDDSAEEDSIQKNEISFLRQGLREGDALLSGVDDLAFKAVTRMYLNECKVPVTAAVSVEYFGGTQDRPACAYDYQPLDAIVEEHFNFFGLTRAENAADADIRFLVLTQPLDAAKKAEYSRTLLAALKECRKALTPVILMDASNGTYGTQFHEMLTDDAELGYLLSYAGFLDMAIVTGTALSHGVARYAWLTNGNGASPAANYAFGKTLVESVVLDLAYKNVVRLQVIDKARGLGGDANNFYAPALDLGLLDKTLSDGMAKAAKPLLKNFSRSNLLVSLEGEDRLAGWSEVSLSDWSFPWSRAFEVRMKISVNDLTKPHESLLSGLFS